MFRSIEEDRITAFAEEFDPQPQHLSERLRLEAVAEAGQLGRPVAGAGGDVSG